MKDTLDSIIRVLAPAKPFEITVDPTSEVEYILTLTVGYCTPADLDRLVGYMKKHGWISGSVAWNKGLDGKGEGCVQLRRPMPMSR